MKLLKDTNDYEYIYEFLFNNLTDIEKKNLLKNMFDRLEVELFKKGTYENNKEKLNIKLTIDRLTKEERDIILSGCLINYYKQNR